MPNVAARPVVDEQPRGVARLRRMLRDQLGRELVVEIGQIHPTRTVTSSAVDAEALQRAQERIEQAAAVRVAPADLDATLERAREQVAALAATTAALEASLPARVGDAVQDGIREQVLPVARHIAEVRGLLN